MYILKLFVPFKDDNEILIESVNDGKLSINFNYCSPDYFIAKLINMKLDDYRSYAKENLNLKSYVYKTDILGSYKYTFLCAETMDQTIKWKEWVESIILINQLT